MQLRARAGLVLCLLAALWPCACARRGEAAGAFRELSIDPSTMRATLAHPIPLTFDSRGKALPILGSYYTESNAGGAISYEHYYQADATAPRIRYTHLEGRPDGSISESQTIRELLSGPFGTVYATTTCYFGSPSPKLPNEFSVALGANDLEHEPATVIEQPPVRVRPTQASIVRVLRRAPAYVVAAAVYSASGRLESLRIGESKNGDWVRPGPGPNPSVDQGFRHFTGSRVQRTLAKRYGIPATFDPSKYAASGAAPFSSAALGSELDAVNLHFADNAWVRQDQFLPTLGQQTRYLTYAATPEDAVLAPLCRRGFQRVGR